VFGDFRKKIPTVDISERKDTRYGTRGAVRLECGRGNQRKEYAKTVTNPWLGFVARSNLAELGEGKRAGKKSEGQIPVRSRASLRLVIDREERARFGALPAGKNWGEVEGRRRKAVG